MNLDLIFLGIGLVLLIPVPLFIGRWSPFLENRSTEMKGIFFITLICVFLNLEFFGNPELLTGFIIGSSLCYLLVFEGIYRIFFFERKAETGKGNNYFLSFSVIVTLILSADYLFFKPVRTNGLNRVDGILLLFLLILFLVMEFRKYSLGDWQEAFFSVEKKGKKILYFIGLTLVLSIGSFLLVNGTIGIAIEKKISFQLLGTFFLSWIVGFIPVYVGREKKIAEQMVRTATFDVVIFFLLFFGAAAAVSPVYLGYEEIYDFIFFGVVSIFLVWKDHIKSNIAGSVMLTLYIAFLLIHVI